MSFDKSTLELEKVWANRFKDAEDKEIQVLGIDWACNLGYGIYELLFEGDKVYGYSEYMDEGEDKGFLRALLEKLADVTEIKE